MKICPTCKQDMAEPPHDGWGGRDCPQCGQGLHWRKWKKFKVARHPRGKKMKKDKSEFRWEIEWKQGSYSTFMPKVPEGWEPFSVTNRNDGIYVIWLRRKVLAQRK